MVVRNNSFNQSFQSKGKRGDHKKIALMRRADTERDSKGMSLTGERKRGVFVDASTPITLPRVKFLERPDHD